MNATQVLQVWQRARRWLVLLLGTAAAVAATSWLWDYFSADTSAQDQFVYYSVTKSDLPIVVTERGSLESQVQTEIRCEVENSTVDRSGNYGTQIIFIVPNGSAVKQGDLLVELDSSALRERLDRQTLDHQRAVSTLIQANARYENQQTQNETLKAEAELKLELAKLKLTMYMDEQSGEHKLALDEIDRTIDEARNQIDESQAALALQRTEKAGIETLFKLGYRGKSDRDQSRFKLLQAEDKLASSMNRLNTAVASRAQMQKYTYEMKRLSLEGDVATAERSLKQVGIDNASKLAQALAAKQEAEGAETKESERLEKLKIQLTKCKINAPHEGMVVYAREDRYSSETQIAEGVSVRERQQILSLPDLSQMQVKTRIHEAVLDQVIVGLPVTVRVESFPDRTYTGIVEQVAVVPSNNGWGGSSVKTYDCVVRIPDKVANLKPGMTAVAEIHVDRIRNILCVPVQSIVQIDKENWCYVGTDQGVEKRKIEVGRSNDKYVQIQSGLALNDRVVLNPMTIMEQQAGEMSISPESGISEAPVVAADAASKAGKADGTKSGPIEKIATKGNTADPAKDRKKRPTGPRPGKRAASDGPSAAQAVPATAGE